MTARSSFFGRSWVVFDAVCPQHLLTSRIYTGCRVMLCGSVLAVIPGVALDEGTLSFLSAARLPLLCLKVIVRSVSRILAGNTAYTGSFRLLFERGEKMA